MLSNNSNSKNSSITANLTSKNDNLTMNNEVIVRFAPSPTGMLHIGGARTAVFNYLFARHNNGKMLLRIEDTDTQRNSQDAINEIIKGLEWLGIDHNSDFLDKLNINHTEKGIVMQSSRYSRHLDVAKRLVDNNKAYYAYDTEEDIAKAKADAEKSGIYYRYNGTKWKNTNSEETKKAINDAIKNGIKPVIRLNIPTGKTAFHDLIRGDIEFDNSTLDDFVLVRSNDTPTYMLAVVVDDMDMNITHVIRGDDHIANTPKQILIYDAMKKSGIKTLANREITIPQFAHIPLIYDIHGKKLSKRKHAVAVSDYQKEGYLNDAIFNYLLLLGWNAGNGEEKEIYSKEEAIKAFDISRCGKSPSRFDFDKLKNINLYYIQQKNDDEIFDMIEPIINKRLEEKQKNRKISTEEKKRIMILMEEIKKYSTINEIANITMQFLDDTEVIETAKPLLENKEKVTYLKNLMLNRIDFQDFQNSFKAELTKDGYKLKDYYPTLRTMLIGIEHGVAIGKIIEAFGNDWVKNKINAF